VAGAAWRATTRIVAGVGELVQRIGDSQTQVGWRCGWSAPCTSRLGAWVSWFDLKTKVDGFSQFGLKTGGSRFSGLGLKIGNYGLMICVSKLLQRFLGLASKPSELRFVSCATKPMWGWRWRGTRVEVEASRARNFQSGLKTVGGATRMVHMASLWRLHRDEAKERLVDATGYIRLFYPNFTVVVVLCHKANVVFWLGI
jgi:hypothetical protein